MDRTDFNNIYQWLLPKLDKRGVSVEKFARQLKISRATLYGYLVDRHRPSEQIMAKICYRLQVPFEEGLRQYTPRPLGAPRKGGGRSRSLVARTRR